MCIINLISHMLEFLEHGKFLANGPGSRLMSPKISNGVGSANIHVISRLVVSVSC